MKSLRFALWAGVIACASTAAHASTEYHASFNVESFPMLRIGSPDYDGPGLLNGQLGDYQHNAEAGLREGRHTVTDPVTGETVTRWANSETSSNRGRNSGHAHSFGSTSAPLRLPTLGEAAGGASVSRFSLGAHATIHSPETADVWGRASWNRDFWIEPGTVFTFSGIAQATVVGDLGAASRTWIEGGGAGSFVSLLTGDVLGRTQASIGATLFNAAGGVQDFITWSASPSGLLSLTFSNHSSERLYGNLQAGAWVDTDAAPVAAPVPEPESLALLAVGMLVVGRVARRKAAQPKAPALA